MKLSFYTIDDLRLGPSGRDVCGWRSRQFLQWHDALEHYLWLPNDRAKVLGAACEDRTVDLFRCVWPYPRDGDGENAALLTYLTDSNWQAARDVLTDLVQSCTNLLHVRYCLDGPDGPALWPAPTSQHLPKNMDGVCLWPHEPGADTAVRWLEVAGVGWLSPEGFAGRFPAPSDFCYPVITRYKADGIRADGRYVRLTVTPWEYRQLERRTRQRR
jgi:hypothetical protein